MKPDGRERVHRRDDEQTRERRYEPRVSTSNGTRHQGPIWHQGDGIGSSHGGERGREQGEVAAWRTLLRGPLCGQDGCRDTHDVAMPRHHHEKEQRRAQGSRRVGDGRSDDRHGAVQGGRVEDSVAGARRPSRENSRTWLEGTGKPQCWRNFTTRRHQRRREPRREQGTEHGEQRNMAAGS